MSITHEKNRSPVRILKPRMNPETKIVRVKPRTTKLIMMKRTEKRKSWKVDPTTKLRIPSMKRPRSGQPGG